MEATPEKLSSTRSTNPLPVGKLESMSGSSPSTLSQTARQTSGVGGFHLSKLEGRAAARLNVEASWFDTTMANSFNPARATKAEIEAYEAAKATINPTLGSPVTRRRIDGLAYNDLEVRKPFADGQMARETLSGDRSLVVHQAALETISDKTQELNSQPVDRSGPQIGRNLVPASSNLGRRFNYASDSASSMLTSLPAAKRRLYPFLPHFSSVQSEKRKAQGHLSRRSDSQSPPIGSQGSIQGPLVIMDINNPTKSRCVSNFAGDIKRKSSISGTDDGPIKRPSSTLCIDPHRGPPEFQPGRMEHLNQFNSIATTYPAEIMPEVNQTFGPTGAYNASATTFGKMAEANYVYESTPENNLFADQNETMTQFNQAYLSTEAYNTSTAQGGPLFHAPAAYHQNLQYATSGYEGGSMPSNTQYNPFPTPYAAPGNSLEPVTQFKQPYHPNGPNGSSGKQNALLEEVNRALGASRPYAPFVDQNVTTARTNQFYRQPSAPVAQSYASTDGFSTPLNSGELPNDLGYGAPGGYNIPGNQGGVMGQLPGFSGLPRSYAPSENQTVGMQNRNQQTNSIGRYTVRGGQAGETPANYHQYGLPAPSLTSPEVQPRLITSANQGYGLSTTYSLYGPQGGGMMQANQLNGPSPSATYVADGSQTGSFGSGSITVGRSESLRTSPERNTKPKELHRPQGQAPNQPLVLKNYFGPNPFGPIAPPSGPIKLPPEQPKKPSSHLHYLAPNGTKPQVDMALDAMNLPFVELCRNTQTFNKGVLRIVNIPWNVNRAEILAFLGRNAQVKEAEEPVHIILDRFSGKTMEAYVEFEDLDEVMNAVNRYYHNKERGRSGRLGDRHVVLEVSCQEALMKALFPKAKNVTWNGPRAVIHAKDPHDTYSSGFQGFLTNEELLLLIKCVEQPQRTPYGVKCPQRPFETIISIIKKYPWYMVDHIILADRDLLFGTARQLTEELHKKILEDPQNIDLNHRLLRRLQLAIFKCPGFTEAQKDDICFICDLDPTREGLAPYADHWYVLKAIGPKPGAVHDVILFYMALLREATTLPGKVSLAERASNEAQIPLVFGNMGIEYPDNVQQMTFAQVARIEWTVIERLLRKALED